MDLKSAMLGGLRSTADAFQNDIDKIASGRLPDQAIKTLGQVLASYNTPGGVMVPKVPVFARPIDIVGAKGQQELEAIDKLLRDLGHTPEPLDLGKEVFTGARKTMPQVILESPVSGRMGEIVLALRKMMADARRELGAPGQ